MGLKLTCDGCGKRVLTSLSKIDNRYLCDTCAKIPNAIPKKFYCNNCMNYSPKALRKGSGWIEFILYLCYLIPGIIYSIWRRSGAPNVCPLCKTVGLIPADAVQIYVEKPVNEIRNEIECPYCAEKILAKAKICKHCGKEISF